MPFTSTAPSTGTVAGSTRLTIQLWLTPKTAAAAAYATAVSTPGNAAYGKFVSPSQYAARYGATAAQASAARTWLKSEGFTGISTSAECDYVTATAPVSVIQAAFKTTMRYYQSSAAVTAGRYRLHANAFALTLPSSLSGIVLSVTGLDNAEPIQPIQRKNSIPARLGAAPRPSQPPSPRPRRPRARRTPARTPTASTPPRSTTRSTYPTNNCGYSAGQLRSAYGASTVNTGKGETVALVELGVTPGMFTTLKDYAASNKLPAPSASRYKELNVGNATFAACGDGFYGEESLDVVGIHLFE